MSNKVRVRFAPSPTGPLHIGGVRTALYNYLYAKKMGGEMILRIEDTDQARYVKGAEEYIAESLNWVGIETSENPTVGGSYGPYRQSERKEIYKEYTQKLIDSGHAYYAFDTPEELDEMRERLKAARIASPQYNTITRGTMKNSLTLPDDEVKERIASGEPYVIRLKVPRKEEIRLNDKIRGWVMVHSSAVDDKVLMKSDGMPTYHLANVVDDHLMKITHVIRGEEWLPSAPLHVLLYKYLGWEEEMPQFAHLPLILKSDGNGKLSKRDSDKHGYPIFPLDWKDPDSDEVYIGFRDQGYLPEACLNFLAFLGWNPGTHEELFTKEELIEAFSLERIGKSGTKFDIDKAKWYNQQYLKMKPDHELVGFLLQKLSEEGIDCEQSKAERIINALKERVTFTDDFWENAKFFFQPPTSYDEKVARKKWNEDAVRGLQVFSSALGSSEDLDAEKVRTILHEELEKLEIPVGKIMQALRLSISGVGAGPDLMEIISILGAEEVASRIGTAIKVLEVKV